MRQSVSSKMNNGTNTDLLDYLSQFGIENNESTIENQQMSLIQQNDGADNNTSGNNSSTPMPPASFTPINDVTTATTTAAAPVTPITTREAIIDPIIDQFPSMPPKRDNGSGNNINTTAEMNALVSQTRSTSPIRPVSAPVVAPSTSAHPAPVTTTHFTPTPTASTTINTTTNVTSTTRTSIKMVGVSSNNTNNGNNGNNSGNVTFTSQPPHTGRKIQISLSTVANKGSMSIHVPQHNVTNGAAAATQTITNQAPQVPQAPADPALGIPESQYDYFFKLSGTEERFKNKWIETIEKAKISKKRNYVVHTIRSGRFRVTEIGMEMLPTTIDTSQSSVTDLLSTQWN